MKADTFAKLVVLEALIDAEIGQFLEEHPTSMDAFREGLIARISDLVDQIDALDAVTAARVYDALVDFLAALPEDDAGVVAATLHFKRAMDRIVERGLHPREQQQSATWAVVLDELLAELAAEYRQAVAPTGEVRVREYARAQGLVARAREVSDRMLWIADRGRNAELREQIDRLTFAVRHQRLSAAEVEGMMQPTQRRVRRYRPSTLSRVGAYVLGQLLARRPRVTRRAEPDREAQRGRSHAGEQPAPA
jgi:hypothetical protein